ncbi:hypothetical protein GCM10010840_33620 [Deinococcus aerolatus]|uniref:Uncharacterized protein n=1 Tax=Deinococcus aerolatus TaxID=522487 RepID=A0ABQ2GFK3_9DEIO|nr:hypothetical protein GCM10010840_33620 [Deinococcus aerolatus]
MAACRARLAGIQAHTHVGIRHVQRDLSPTGQRCTHGRNDGGQRFQGEREKRHPASIRGDVWSTGHKKSPPEGRESGSGSGKGLAYQGGGELSQTFQILGGATEAFRGPGRAAFWRSNLNAVAAITAGKLRISGALLCALTLAPGLAKVQAA